MKSKQQFSIERVAKTNQTQSNVHGCMCVFVWVWRITLPHPHATTTTMTNCWWLVWKNANGTQKNNFRNVNKLFTIMETVRWYVCVSANLSGCVQAVVTTVYAIANGIFGKTRTHLSLYKAKMAYYECCVYVCL